MLRHAFDQIEIGIDAAREHELVEGKHATAFAEVVDLFGFVVDLGDLRHADIAAMDHLPMWGDDVTGQDRCTHYFGQQRVERDEVLLAHQCQLPPGRQPMLELLSERDPCESAAHDYQVLERHLGRSHGEAPSTAE